jgi:protoheme IX farnesyltransferase
MLPTGKRDAKTAVQIILYTFWLIVASVLPVFGFTGSLTLSIVGAVVVILLGLWMLYFAFKLYKNRDAISAKKLMLVSVTYITLLQIVYVIDKFI